METIKYLSVEEWINNTILLSYREIVLIVNIGKMTEQELHWLTWTNIKTLITICKLDPNSSCTLKRPHSRKCSFLHEQIFHFYWIIPMSMQLAILIHSFFQKKKRDYSFIFGCCAGSLLLRVDFPSGGTQGLLFMEVRGFLTVGAPRSWSIGSRGASFSSCSLRLSSCSSGAPECWLRSGGTRA